MIKGVLCLIVISFSALAGWSKASGYAERVRALADLTSNIKYLESEMIFRMEALPVILDRIGESRRENGGAFFSETARILNSEETESLWNAWLEGLDRVYGTGVLTAADRKIIEELGYELGRTDMETQKQLFAHCYTGLARQEADAREEARVKGRMYRGLGVSAGILIAVLLL